MTPLIGCFFIRSPLSNPPSTTTPVQSTNILRINQRHMAIVTSNDTTDLFSIII